MTLVASIYFFVHGCVEPELDTDRDSMPGYWHTKTTASPNARAGYVELYFRTSQSPFVLKFPGREDRISKLRLPANPMKVKHRAWSGWQNPDFVAKAGEQPSRFSRGSDYQIHYKLDYQELQRAVYLLRSARKVEVCRSQRSR